MIFEDASVNLNAEEPPTGDVVIRRSERLANKFGAECNFSAVSFISRDPTTVQEALNCEQAAEWRAAMDSEINSLAANYTWTLTVP